MRETRSTSAGKLDLVLSLRVPYTYRGIMPLVPHVFSQTKRESDNCFPFRNEASFFGLVYVNPFSDWCTPRQDYRQGRSQPHCPGVGKISTFLKFSSNFDQFDLFFLKVFSFASSFWPSGWASRPPGKALATLLII